jgi:hypothetical protein
MRTACWHCGEAATPDEILARAHLVPRTAREGGPVLLFRCRACDIDSVVEKNPAEDVFLTPPPVLGFRSPTIRGDVRYAARRWIAAHEADRRRFLAGEELPEDEATPHSAPGAACGVASVLEARAVLGLEAGASAATVRRRYRELARKVHPDRAGGRDEEFRRLVAAYELVMAELSPGDRPERPDSR